MMAAGLSPPADAGGWTEEMLETVVAWGDERARALVDDKYARGYGGELSRWRRSALPVAVDLDHETTTGGGPR
jgi:hypothetical protein